MRSIRWIGWVALVALFVVPLAATPALAAPNFTGTPLAGVVPLTVTFTPTGVTGVPDSITWSFGDGGWANGAGVKVHAYTTGPADYTVVMSVWYTASADSIISKGSYVSVVPPSIVAYDTNKAPCAVPAPNGNLPDTVLFEFFSRPADSVWWIIKDNPTGGTFIDSIRTTGASKFLLTYVFTLPDTFLVTGKSFVGDSLITADTAVYVYITSDCFCVQAVLDGYSMNEGDTLRAFVLDNDTLGNKNQPRPVDSIHIFPAHGFNSDVMDTAYFDTTTTGIWRLVYIPQANWHGKDTLTYAVFVHDGCDSGLATVAITVYSNFMVDIDSLWYVLKDMCTNSCDVDPNTISLHDSLQLWVKINPVDVQELAPGWPKAFFAGLGGSAGGDVMFQDTTGGDSIYFSIPFQDTAGAYPDWREILGGGIDVAPGFYAISAQIMSDSVKLSAETTVVTQRIDTKGPALPPNSVTFTMDYDSLANGIVGMGDWLKFYIDLRNNPIFYNPPWAKEICKVTVKLDSTWYGAPVWITLVDSANDNRFKGYHKVGPGILDTVGNSKNAWFFISDNACNIDSVFATLAPPVDNEAPFLDSAVIVYEKILDRDSTNCLGVGASDPLADSVLIRVTHVDSDVDSLWADLLRAGIGGSNTTLAARYPLVSKGAGVWELRWLLKTNLLDKVKHPIDGDSISPTIDTLPPNAKVKIIAADLSGNGDFKWSDSLAQSIDTRVPKPVTGLTCMRDTSAAGTTFFRLKWLTHDRDAEKFLIYWNDGSGNIDYNTILAVQFDTTWTRWWNKWSATDSLLDSGYMWVTDSTVKPISPCRNYKFNVYTVDNCNNLERSHPTETSCGITVPPVANLSSSTPECGRVVLTWTRTDSNAAKYYIYWDAGTDTVKYTTFLDTVRALPGQTTVTWDKYDPTLFKPVLDSSGPRLYKKKAYKFVVRQIDSCGNWNYSTDFVRDTIDPITPITNYSCSSINAGAIELKWKQPVAWVGKFYIFYGKDGEIDWTTAVDTITEFQSGIYSSATQFYTWNTTMTNPALNLIEKGWYNFFVVSEDQCGFYEGQHRDSTGCWSDKAPAYACVIQPAPGSLYCDTTGHGLTIYACPKDSASNDIAGVTAWGRRVTTPPDEWFPISGPSTGRSGNCFVIPLDFNILNDSVGVDTVRKIEVAITTTDLVGKTISPDVAWAACATQYWFDWSTRTIEGRIRSINGQPKVWQERCGVRGFQVYGAVNPVAIKITDGGTPPYTLRVKVDGNAYLYQERVSDSIIFNLNATGFAVGGHWMDVFWNDSCGWSGGKGDSLCVPDSVAPCAIVTNPVDGKCIRRSLSMLDPIGAYEQPITITIKGNDLIGNCVDQSGVLKVDFQWSKDCCTGDLVDTTWISTWRNCDDTLGNGDNLVCDTIFDFYGPGRHSITCRDTTITPTCSTNVWTMVVDTVPCENLYAWNTFAIDSANGTLIYQANWMNKQDLAWITESGTNIWLRGIVYDNNGNKFYTPCVQVCIDIDTPPICIRTEDLCPDGRLNGFAKILAELNWPEGNIDDIEDIYLYTKKSSDPDLFGSWKSWDAGEPGTNSTMWTWNIHTTDQYFADQTYYDFRVIAKTVWGTWSYDLNGDEQFDAHTFDTTNCDAKTWLVDHTPANIVIDTAWTTINGEELVIPNTGCRVSDPKGYIWTQYGNEITVQPTVYPLGDMGDVVKTQWTLYDGDDASCTCKADTSFFVNELADSYVFAVNEGDKALDNLVFDPTKAPFVHKTNGYQTHVLNVKAWDACGNLSEDCVTIYLLDIDTTEAILISPKNDSVFCDKMSIDGGIRLTAATLLANRMKEAIFAYREKGDPDWIMIGDTTLWHSDSTTLSVMWYPKASGLSDGNYEVTVWAIDKSLNRQVGDGYPVTIHFSCAVPTVAVTYPTTGSPKFIGCPIELIAKAWSSDMANPIVQVDFYVQSILSSTAIWIGADEYTVDSLWSVSWDPHSTYWKGQLSDGQYYIWAKAKNRAGLTTSSVLNAVIVRYDETGPHSQIIQVNGDRSDDSPADPTIVLSGSIVPLYVLSADDLSPAGSGLTDNSGLDSVMIYVTEDASIGGKVVFGEPMGYDSLSSMYMKNWPTAGLDRGLYHVTAVAIDKACNRAACQCDWLVRIVNPAPAATIGVIDAVQYCDNWNVKDGPITIAVAPAENEAIKTVEIWRSKASSSDVFDQWSFVGMSNEMEDGLFLIEVDADSLDAWDEGLYRLRAFYESTDETWIDDDDFNDKFDDFSFDAVHKTWQMMLNVDRSITDFSVALDPSMTLLDGRQVKVTVTPVEACDVAEVCYGVVAENGNYATAKDGCISTTTFSFNPVDSGLVSLNNGVWHGSVRATVSDGVGNSDYLDTPLWILHLTDTNQVRVVSPLHGAYVTGIGDTLTSVTARKLTWTSLDSVVFYHDATATGAGERFGKAAKTAGSDEFTATWNIKNVPEGDRYIWGVAWRGATKFDTDVPRTWVIVTKTPKDIVLNDPNPHWTRTVGPDEIMFVGGRVDLCLDREAISSIVSGVGIDSVVFGYRYGDAPGGVPTSPDPAQGWVRINVDRYGSLCVDWFTCDSLECLDGRYALAAWVYDKAGHVNHSNIVHVMVDCTDPYSEIVDVDGDETFGDCHDITLTGTDTQVKLTANAIDNLSCAGSTPGYNSGAKYLQFFVGQCGEGSGGAADIVFVVDGSGSMGDDQEAIANNAAAFFAGLSGLDAQYGVQAYTDIANPIATNGTFKTGGPGAGEFTTDAATLGTMVTAVGSGGSSTENGLTALNNALAWYPWRSGATKVLILVTDENADDLSDIASLQPPLLASGAMINTVVSFGDSAGYSALAPSTNGLTLDITASWGSSLTALASQIRAVAGTGVGNDVGVIWNSGLVTLTDGQDDAFALWNPRGLKTGTYCTWTVVIDQIGNSYTSVPVSLCIYDKTPPVGWIAGFGTSTDENQVHEYAIYGRSTDKDIDHVQFQYRLATSTVETDWTGIGISAMVNGDSTLWMADWKPCLEAAGDYKFRMVPTDKSDNENFDMQPLLTVRIDGACGLTLPDAPQGLTVAFEDRAFANLGRVEVTGAPTDKANSMLAVYADLKGSLGVEKVNLRQYIDVASEYEGSFDDALILNGGIGWFWNAYNDFAGKKTYLKKADLRVWLVTDVGFPGKLINQHPYTEVELDDDALTSENGVVIFPAHDPTVWLDQQHLRAWPSEQGADMVTSIRLTSPLEGYFNEGRYAKVTISYFAPEEILSTDLAVGWWDGDRWNTTDDIKAGGAIANGKATFYTKNLHGVYAVVSAGGVYSPGAVEVAISSFLPYSGLYTSAKPTIITTVRSKLEYEWHNEDIDADKIILTLDGKVLYSEQRDAYGYIIHWGRLTGDLKLEWDGAPALSSGSHWIKVQAFNKSGYWNYDSTSFTVDATEPNVNTTTSYVCPNPTFKFTVTDQHAGVNWDSVYIDVYDVTGSEFSVVPASRLIHTETPDAWDRSANGDTVMFTLTDQIAEGRRIRIVIYDGDRYTYYDDIGCHCEYYYYDHDVDGVPDLVGNHTEVVEEDFTVSTVACGTGMTGAIEVVKSGTSKNPFDPAGGEAVQFNMNGFNAGGGVTATVYDLTGERVKGLGVNAIQGAATWDGRNDDGDIVADGVYLVHFQRTGSTASGATSQALKVVVKRK